MNNMDIDILTLPCLITLTGYRHKIKIIEWLNNHPAELYNEGLEFNGTVNAYGLPIVRVKNKIIKNKKEWRPNLNF
jgi:hypothetical protein